jgi:hypothetical protein
MSNQPKQSGAGFFDNLFKFGKNENLATVEILPMFRHINEQLVWNLSRTLEDAKFLKIDKTQSGPTAKLNSNEKLRLSTTEELKSKNTRVIKIETDDRFQGNKINEHLKFPFHYKKHEIMRCSQEFELYIQLPMVFLPKSSVCHPMSYRTISIIATKVTPSQQVLLYARYKRFGEKTDTILKRAANSTVSLDIIDKKTEEEIMKRFGIKESMYYVFAEDVLQTIYSQYNQRINEYTFDDVVSPIFNTPKCVVDDPDVEKIRKLLLNNLEGVLSGKGAPSVQRPGGNPSLAEKTAEIVRGASKELTIKQIFENKDFKMSYIDILMNNNKQMFNRFEILDDDTQKRVGLTVVKTTKHAYIAPDQTESKDPKNDLYKIRITLDLVE